MSGAAPTVPLRRLGSTSGTVRGQLWDGAGHLRDGGAHGPRGPGARGHGARGTGHASLLHRTGGAGRSPQVGRGDNAISPPAATLAAWSAGRVAAGAASAGRRSAAWVASAANAASAASAASAARAARAARAASAARAAVDRVPAHGGGGPRRPGASLRRVGGSVGGGSVSGGRRSGCRSRLSRRRSSRPSSGPSSRRSRWRARSRGPRSRLRLRLRLRLRRNLPGAEPERHRRRAGQRGPGRSTGTGRPTPGSCSALGRHRPPTTAPGTAASTSPRRRACRWSPRTPAPSPSRVPWAVGPSSPWTTVTAS